MPEQRMEFAIFSTKLVAMVMFLEILEKEVQIDHLHLKVSFGEKIAKISSADPEIIVLRAIIKEERKK